MSHIGKTQILWISFSIGIVGLIISIIIWQALITQEEISIKRTVKTEGIGIRKKIVLALEERILALERMGRRFEKRRGTHQEEWKSDATNYYMHQPGYQAIEWIDTSFHVRWSVPIKTNNSARNRSVRFGDLQRIAMKTVQRRGTATMTRSTELEQGGKGFLIYIPLYFDKNFSGFIRGVFGTQTLFQSILKEDISEGYSIAIYDGDTKIFKGYNDSSKTDGKWVQEFPVKIRGITWRVQVWPKSSLLANMQSQLPLVFLIVSFFITFLLVLTAWLPQTARLKAVETLALNQELEKEITERKRAEGKLLHALEETKAASQAKSQFLSTMSHELRSPLNAVIGFSELLIIESGDKMTRELAPKINDSGRYLLAMIEDILDLDRIETGKVRLKADLTSINDLVSGVVSAWHPRLPEKFSINLEVDSTCGIISCDSTRIRQILNNLIDNAVKYSPKGGTIRVQTQTNEDEIWIRVQDEGMGISHDGREAIFERFHQLEQGYNRRAGGLGIGLALARELMEMHGGRIWVESEEGYGSTFYVALPKNRPVGLNAPGDENGKGDMGGNEEPWEGRTILVVDDVEHYHEYMKLLMTSAAQIDSAHNGNEAIETARRENPDLILMDLRMPIMDGFDAIERLKTDPTTKDIPIIAVTAQAMEEDRVRALHTGANGFVTKPVEIEAFSKELWRVLGVRA